MMSMVPTLLVAVVTFIAIMSSASPPATGGGLGCGAVSRFVCVHCTSTGKLSSRGLFLARAAVRRHISATKSCRKAGLGFGRYILKPGPAMSWPERVARRGRRRTFDTSHQVKKSVVSKKTIHIPSRFNIETEEAPLVA